MGLMSVLKNALLATVLSSLFFASPASCVKSQKGIGIYEGGYKFHTSYKISPPAATRDLGSHIVVKLTQGPELCSTKAEFVKNKSPEFLASAEFKLKNLLAHVQTGTGFIKSKKKSNIPEKSKWIPAIKQLFNTVVKRYHIESVRSRAPKNWRPYWKKHCKDKYSFEKSPAFNIQAQPHCKLHTRYLLKAKSYPSRYPKNVIMDVSTQFEVISQIGPEKVLAVTVAYYSQKHPKLIDPVSVVKFVQKKGDFKVIFKKNIKKSCIWYPKVKTIVKKSVKRFARLKALHNSMVKKTNPTKAKQS